MAGKIRLFEKLPDGRLAEVAPDEAEARRAGRRTSHVVLPIDILWTDEEEAQAEAEQVEQAEALGKEKKAREDRVQRRAEIAGRIGLTMDELEDLLK
jgi:hypothetical protein